ncbi:NAD(P)-dependent dehydrogenase (short-subunit alcohol dehydrogenase family) [Lewinella aquimaris]|uniref:NAD(P)-dependent dehydrogenase (Short-subunit alcohol dehydrogenase family) n=1 Tax=Neolewinella aquimaris TaxID=1835722 RepID=A0A840EFL8_9BACT|nr:SDR family oxidoreductase [Neolewinella aquimaris]MBB4080599.1 NAD(P)-dependent dehydrogenase (short-subunit alcohol dehydrogenase family) [Neolewinella aquimaris]
MPQIALVTGASSGVGEALSLLLTDRGWRVYGLSRRSVELEGVIALPADISDAEAIRRAVGQLLDREGRLDAVLHCAGVGGAGAVESMPEEQARQVMEANFWGSWNVCQATLPYLRKSPRARLLLVSSIAGHMGIPFRSVYCASKAAVIALSDSLRLELRGSTVQVACISPGDIATNSIATQYRQPAGDLDPLYRERYRRADEAMVNNVDQGMSARHVAEKMAAILERETLSPHYVIGEPVQKLSTIAQRILPGRAWEWVLGRYYS